MRKRLIAVVMTVIFAFGMTGCGQNKEDYKEDKTKIMNIVETGGMHNVYVDTETGVMYLRTYNGGVCVMVNPDGTPKIWSE